MTTRDTDRAFGIGMVVSSEHRGEPRVHRALPSLSARFVVSLDDDVDVTYAARVLRRRAVFAGLMRPGHSVPTLMLRPNQRSVYVELSPRAAERLLGGPLRLLDAGGVDAADALPWTVSLADELAQLGTHAEREDVMRRRLLQRLADSAEPRTVDAWAALELLRRSDGRLSTNDLAQRMHVSTRQLRHVMARDVGIGPKFAGRIARFAAGITRASSGAPSWSAVAADVGFYDQSHLVGEFRALMGVTPSQWMAEERRNLQGWPTVPG